MDQTEDTKELADDVETTDHQSVPVVVVAAVDLVYIELTLIVE